jgi:hypothetical protein
MGNAPTSSLPKYNQAARIEIQTPQSEENCGTRVKFARDKRNHQTYLLNVVNFFQCIMFWWNFITRIFVLDISMWFNGGFRCRPIFSSFFLGFIFILTSRRFCSMQILNNTRGVHGEGKIAKFPFNV